jgi:hypothetical protein
VDPKTLRTPLIVLALIAAATLPAGSAPRTELEASSPGAVRFQVTFDAPRWIEPEGDSPYRYLEFPGTGTAGAPGDPAVPEKRIRVAVPPTGAVELSAEVATRGRAGGLRFPPSPVPETMNDRPVRRGDREPASGLRESAAYVRPESPPWAEIVAEGIERDVRIVVVAVRPVRWNPVSGEAEWAERVDVTVRTAETPARPASSPRRAGPRSADATLINPADASRFATASFQAAPCDSGRPAVWFDDAPGWLKIRIAANGVYRLSRQDLAAAGVPIDTADPRTLRLYAGPLVPEVGWAAAGWDSVPCDPARVVGHRPHVYERPG